MNLRFIKKKNIDDGFWLPKIRYDFYIIYEDNEDFELFEKEFNLNCKYQIE